jgi:DNA polymerase/3'-5' exonuclease PolX
MDQLAAHLAEIGKLFTTAGEHFKAKAYFKVVGVVRNNELVFENGKLIGKYPGIGKSITSTIEEFIATGSSKVFKHLKDSTTEPEIVRQPIEEMLAVTDPIIAYLERAGFDVGYAGSVRRGSATVRDVDVIICVNSEADKEIVLQLMQNLGFVADIRSGKKKLGFTISLLNGAITSFDLNFCTKENRGAYYLYFTGPREMNIEMRTYAKTNGMRINEYGIFSGNNKLAGETEEGMFAVLGFEYVEPKDRSAGCLRRL